MLSGISGAIVTALLAILGKLATQQFFEQVLIKIILYTGDKLANMTTNKLDDELMDKVRMALQPEPEGEKVEAQLVQGDTPEAPKNIVVNGHTYKY